MSREERGKELLVLLGRGARFEGRLTFEGRARVDGELVGEVLTEGLLVVGEAGVLECREVRVGALIVRGGTVRGNVVARESVEVYAPGKVYGNLTAPQVSLEKGVLFEGVCRMSPGESAEVPEVPAPEPEPEE